MADAVTQAAPTSRGGILGSTVDFGGHFKFWPKQYEAIYKRLLSKHAWLEVRHHPEL